MSSVFAYPHYVDVVAAISAVAKDAGEPLVEEIQGSYLASSTRASSAGEPSVDKAQRPYVASSTGAGEPSMEDIQAVPLNSSTGVGEPSIEEIQGALLASRRCRRAIYGRDSVWFQHHQHKC